MRILHVGKFYPPVPGGIERSVADIAHATAGAGADVAVLAHAPPGHAHTRAYADGRVRVHETGCWGQLLYAPVSPGFPFVLQRLLREFRPDLLHMHVPNTSAFAALALPAARRLPWVVHWHSDIPLDGGSRALRLAYPLYRPWEQALLRHAAAIVATSTPYRDASDALARWHGKVEVIPLSLPDDMSPMDGRFDWPNGRLRVLAVGRLSHYKGFDVLLRALADVPDAALGLIGDGEEVDRLHWIADERQLGDRVRFCGRVDDAALRCAYANADVFCLPSLDRAEAFGLVLLEAMRAKLPIIASNIHGAGVGYVVRDGVTGLLVPPGDPNALAAALRRLAADSALRERLGAAGERRWRDEFTPARTTPALLALYRRVLADRAAAKR